MSEFYGMDKLSLVDYDNKLTCTIFTAGCNFKCPFCHNASLVLDEENLDVFPLSDILSYLNKRKGILEAVCVSGGEPTLSGDLDEKLAEIKKMGYIVKLDTNGSNPNKIKSLYEKGLIDYVAMDIKNSEEKYPETIGLKKYDLRKIKESIEFILNCGIDYEFRTTLVSQFHEEEDILKIGKMIKGAKRYYLQKFVDHDSCIEEGHKEISKEKALKFQSLIQPYVKNVYLRGY